MEELVNVVVNNGLGVASFIALIYFINTSMKKTNETLEEVNKSLITIQTTMITLNNRMEELEKIKKETRK